MTKRQWRKEAIKYFKLRCGGLRKSYIRFEVKRLCDSFYNGKETNTDIKSHIEYVFFKIRNGDDRGYQR